MKTAQTMGALYSKVVWGEGVGEDGNENELRLSETLSEMPDLQVRMTIAKGGVFPLSLIHISEPTRPY